jgi:hypothetical protein
MTFHIGFLVAYDFNYLKQSIPCVYPEADKIVLALDQRRLSFTGQPFRFDEAFKNWITEIDTDQKITWLEAPFYKEGLSPFEAVMAMRNQLLQAMQPADWYMQLDADEYLLDCKGFKHWLTTQKFPKEQIVQVRVAWKTIFKSVHQGYLLIGGKPEYITIATNVPINTKERFHDAAHTITAPFTLLHQSWARDESEVLQKIKNWSHANDFDAMKFFGFWKKCTFKNYKYVRNLNPLHGPNWPCLELVWVKDIMGLIAFYRKYPPTFTDPPHLPLWYKGLQKIKKKLGLVQHSS